MFEISINMGVHPYTCLRIDFVSFLTCADYFNSFFALQSVQALSAKGHWRIHCRFKNYFFFQCWVVFLLKNFLDSARCNSSQLSWI